MFNLHTSEGWSALGAAWRVARSNWSVALDEFSDAEMRAADDPSRRQPDAEPTHEAMMAARAHNDALDALHGVTQADALQSAASHVDGALVDAALGVRAPTLAAFLLKLDMVSDGGGWNDFDDATWLLFVADVRRFAGLKALNKKETCQ